MTKRKKQIENIANNEVPGDAPTHLMKSGSVTRNSTRRQYYEFSKKIPKTWRGVKLDYDLWYDLADKKDPDTGKYFIPGFVYTDMLNKCLYFRTPNSQLNKSLLRTILRNHKEPVDTKVLWRITNSLSDKYTLYNHQNIEWHDRVVFLPGTNIIDNILDFDYVKQLVDNEGAKIKPHPLTTKYHMFMLKKMYGEQNILGNMASGFEYLLHAKVVFCCKNSEMGLTALLLNKDMCLADTPKYTGPKTYGSLYEAILYDSPLNPSKSLAKILSSEYSGIIHIEDPEAERKMYNLLNSYNLLVKK
jgi:hypothetical protein